MIKDVHITLLGLHDEVVAYHHPGLAATTTAAEQALLDFRMNLRPVEHLLVSEYVCPTCVISFAERIFLTWSNLLSAAV